MDNENMQLQQNLTNYANELKTLENFKKSNAIEESNGIKYHILLGTTHVF